MSREPRAEPYDWPSKAEWLAMSNDERIRRAESLVALSELRRAPGVKKGWLTQAQRHAADLLVDAQRRMGGEG